MGHNGHVFLAALRQQCRRLSITYRCRRFLPQSVTRRLWQFQAYRLQSFHSGAPQHDHQLFSPSNEGNDWESLLHEPAEASAEAHSRTIKANETLHQISQQHDMADTGPEIELYHRAIQKNSSAENGSAAELERIFACMSEDGIAPTFKTWDYMIRALAVHPHHLLRSHAIYALQGTYGQSLPAHTRHFIVAGLLRDRQLEQALDAIYQMHTDEIEVKEWLLDMTLHVLSIANEFDEVMKLIETFVDIDSKTYDDHPGLGRLDLSEQMWFSLLDRAACAMHYPCTKLIFHMRDRSTIFRLPTGLCENILTCAARNGDVDMATKTFSSLAQRAGSSLHDTHYEALIDVYLRADDLRSAFSLLQTMQTSGYAPGPASTRALSSYLGAAAARVPEALAILKDLEKSSGREAPLVAYNLIMEAFIQHDELHQAMKVYCLLDVDTAAPQTSESGFEPSSQSSGTTRPDMTTFQTLLHGCARQGQLALAEGLLQDMATCGLQRDTKTLIRLIQCGIHPVHSNVSVAWGYVDELLQKGSMLNPKLALRLARRAAEVEDSRVWTLTSPDAVPQDIQAMKGDGHAVRNVIDAVELRKLVSKHWGKRQGD